MIKKMWTIFSISLLFFLVGFVFLEDEISRLAFFVYAGIIGVASIVPIKILWKEKFKLEDVMFLIITLLPTLGVAYKTAQLLTLLLVMICRMIPF